MQSDALIERLRSALVQLFWSRFFRAGGVRTWMAEPRVRRYINESVTGSEHRWPTDWLKRRYAAEPFARGLSLGCGEGALERDVIRKGICTEVVGIDLSRAALERAQAAARRAGLAGISYRRGDMDRLELGAGAFDVVFFHQSLHHVRNLEGCLDEVSRALAPGGKVYLDEYVGPSRGDWRRELLADAEAVFRELPAGVKRRRRLGVPVDWRDPSEAVRSAEIVPQLLERFTIVERRDYGGNLLAVIHPLLRHDLLAEPVGEEALERLIAAEKDLLERGAPSYYAVIVAEPR